MCALIVVQAGAEARADASAAATIVGTWDVVVDIINCDTGATIASGGSALGLFNADGTRHETNATNPALRTPGYGNWHHVKNNKFQFAFKFYRFDGTGANIGSTSVRHNLFLSANRNGYYSRGTAEFFDPAGNLLFIACSTAKAKRFK
jgi:hypothetical protein